MKLGIVKRPSGHGDKSITFHTLGAEGYDSVLITGLRTGDEYVVYNWDQVDSIEATTLERFTEDRENCVWFDLAAMSAHINIQSMDGPLKADGTPDIVGG